MFKTKEICDLVELPVLTLNEWVRSGRVTPAVKCGPPSGHRWTYAQGLGLAVVAPMYNSERGCSPTYLARVMARFKEMKSAMVHAWVTDQKDAHSEELYAEFLAEANRPNPGWPEKNSDEEKAWLVASGAPEAHRITRKVCAAIRRKLNIPDPPAANGAPANRLAAKQQQVTPVEK